MEKKKLILNIDLGFHGIKVRSTCPETNTVDYFNVPAEAVICPENSFSGLAKLNEGKSMGLFMKKDGELYAIGMCALDYISNYSFRSNYYDELAKDDKAFYDLSPKRFTSRMCDSCVLGSVLIAINRLIDSGVVAGYDDVILEAVCFVLPHDIVVDKNSVAADHLWDLMENKNSLEVSFDAGKTFISVSFNNENNDNNVTVNCGNLFVQGQAGAVLYDSILNADLSVKKFKDSKGVEHDILSDPHYFNPLLILDIGKRTCKPLIMRNLGTVEEISGFDDMKYAMYNVDELVAEEINTKFELAEGSSGFLYADDIDRLLASGQNIYNPFHTGDENGADIYALRKKAVKYLSALMIEDIFKLTREGSRFFDFMCLVCIAGGAAQLFYPELKKMIAKNRMAPREDSIILCEEEYTKDSKSSVYSVVGGSYRKLIFENPELI